MTDNQRPNSFYDSRTISTLGGASMALFVISTIIRFFLLNEKSEYKLLCLCKDEDKCNLNISTKFIFFFIVFGLALILAVIRQFANELDKKKQTEEVTKKGENLPENGKTTDVNAPPNNNPDTPKPSFWERLKAYFSLQKVILRLRHTILIVINSFLIVASASGLSAVGGDSWFNSRTDKALIQQKEEEIKKKDQIIKEDISPKKQKAELLEKKAIEAVLKPDYDSAASYFQQCEGIYPSFRSAYEMQRFLKTQNSINVEAQKRVLDTIINTYYHLPKNLEDDLRKKQRELAVNQ